MKKEDVIVTFVLIGIIVAVGIPMLMNDYANKKNVEGLKKAYETFNIALNKITSSRGCMDDLKCTHLFDEGTTDESFGGEVVKYFNVAKNCGTTPGHKCFAPYTNDSYDGSSKGVYELDNWSGYRFLTKDGMSYYVWNYAKHCSENDSTYKTGDLTQACGEVYVDVNGPDKGPNRMGRDTFNLWISNGKGATLYPMGAVDTKWSDQDWRWVDPLNKKHLLHCYPGEPTGWPCAGRIMEQGWKMNY